MTNKPYIVIDFETSGLNFQGVNRADGHWPVSLAMRRMNNGHVEARYYEFFAPTEESRRNWSPHAEAIHGITLAELDSGTVKGKPVIDFLNDVAAQRQLADFLGLGLPVSERPELLIQNAPADMAFLNKMLAAAGHGPITYARVYCSKAIASIALKPGESTSLNAMATTYLGRGQSAHHLADEDCELADGMFRYFQQNHPQAVKYFPEILQQVLTPLGMNIEAIGLDRITVGWPLDKRYQYRPVMDLLTPLVVEGDDNRLTLHLNDLNRSLHEITPLVARCTAAGRER